MPEETPVISATLFSIMSFHPSRKHQPSLSQPASAPDLISGFSCLYCFLCRLTEAASDTQCFARDPLRIRRSEKDRAGSDVLRLAENIHVKVFMELLLGDLFKWRPVVNSRVVD